MGNRAPPPPRGRRMMTVHREQEALIIAVAAARKTLDEARAHKCTAALAWEKEKTIAHHLEQ
jgi:hypothetical protein